MVDKEFVINLKKSRDKDFGGVIKASGELFRMLVECHSGERNNFGWPVLCTPKLIEDTSLPEGCYTFGGTKKYFIPVVQEQLTV